MTNILLLQSTFHLGGAEKMTHCIFSGLNQEKYTTIVCTLYEPGPMAQPFFEGGFTFYHNLIKNKLDVSAFWKLNKIIKKHRIDLVYLINQPLTIFWGYIAGTYNKIPIVPVVHNTPVLSEHFKLYIYKLLLPRAARVLTVSELQKTHLTNSERLSKDNIEVIHNGIDLKSFGSHYDKAKILSELNINPDKKIVGIVTRLVSLKGIDIFLKAAAIVLKNMRNVQFLIIGDGPERNDLKILSRELQIENNISFLGIRHDIAKLVSVFDVALLSSRTEALPMVILEYFACRKAVVSTNVGSVSEIIIDNVNGFLVNSEKPDQLAEKTLVLLQDENQARIFSEAAFRMVSDHFSLRETVSKTEDVIDDVVKNGSRRIHVQT